MADEYVVIKVKKDDDNWGALIFVALILAVVYMVVLFLIWLLTGVLNAALITAQAIVLFSASWLIGIVVAHLAAYKTGQWLGKTDDAVSYTECRVVNGLVVIFAGLVSGLVLWIVQDLFEYRLHIWMVDRSAGWQWRALDHATTEMVAFAVAPVVAMAIAYFGELAWAYSPLSYQMQQRERTWPALSNALRALKAPSRTPLTLSDAQLNAFVLKGGPSKDGSSNAYPS